MPTKPPLGVMPRLTHDSLRRQALLQAMYRYEEAGHKIPNDWIIELTDLL